MGKTKVQVTIHNATYNLVTDESEAHLKYASSYVDELIRSTMDMGIDEINKAVVLVALQLASRALKAEERVHQQEDDKRRLIEKIERESQLLASLS